MRRELADYPEEIYCDPYDQIQRRIRPETHIAGGVIVFEEIMHQEQVGHFTSRYIIVKGFRKTSLWRRDRVGIPFASEVQRINADLIERLNADPILPKIDINHGITYDSVSLTNSSGRHHSPFQLSYPSSYGNRTGPWIF